MTRARFSKEYRDFIKSPEWEAIRALVIKRDGHKCTKCGTKGGKGNPLQANHLCYPPHGSPIEAFINQPLSQIQTLCANCHKQHTIHERRKARKQKNVKH